MCVALALEGAIAWIFAGAQLPVSVPAAATEPPAPSSGSPGTERGSGRGARLVAALAVGLVVASWTARTIASLRHGMETVDTLWYHMPTAARFVQTGFTSHLHYVDADPVTVFYPAVSPLLHGFGIQLFGNDVLSPFVNLGWLALALVSAWSIGEPYGVAPATLTGAAVVLSTPGLVTTQPGGAYTDVVGLALLLASVALLVHTSRAGTNRLPGVALAALAAGLAVGTKFTLLAPVGALTLVFILETVLGSDRSRNRIRELGVWCALVFTAGGFFYVRNTASVGNPLPSLSFGPLRLPTPPVPSQTFTVAQYLFKTAIWRHYYLPGLWDSLGPAWWALVAMAIGSGAVLFARSRSVLERALGIVPLLTIVGYLFTPQFLGLPDHPIFFVFNVRYLTPALGVGLCLIPTLPSLVSAARARFVAPALFVALLVTQWGPSIWAWSKPISAQRFTERIVRFDVVAGIAIGLLVAVIGIAFLVFRLRTSVAVLTVAALTIAILGGYPVQQAYLRRRYLSTPPMPHIYRWAQDQTHQRIAIVGSVLQYPLYGKRLSNYVQYVGRRGPHGSFTPFTTCAGWRQALNAGGYGWVVIVPNGFTLIANPGIPREQRWTSTDPNARLVARDLDPGFGAAVLYRIDGRLDPDSC
jgi:hypothetical protein